MAKTQPLLEVESKILYQGPEPGTLVQFFKDESLCAEVAASDTQGPVLSGPSGQASDRGSQQHEGASDSDRAPGRAPGHTPDASPDASSGHASNRFSKGRGLARGSSHVSVGSPMVRLQNKGIFCNRISEFTARRLAELGLPTHFIRRQGPQSQLVLALEVLPVEMRLVHFVRPRHTYPTLPPVGTPLRAPLLEYFPWDQHPGSVEKIANRAPPCLSEDHLTSFGVLTHAELDEIVSIAHRVDDFLQGLYAGARLRPIEFSIHFGRYCNSHGESSFLIADDLLPDPRLLRFQGEKTEKTGTLYDVYGAGSYRFIAERFGLLHGLA